MPIVEIAHIIEILGYGGAIGGSVAHWCKHHHCKRDVDVPIIDTESVPKMVVWSRAAVGPCNIPTYNYDMCHSQLKGQTIQVESSIPATGVAQFDNVPPACMDIAGALGGSCTGENPRPTPCGSACMRYTGLSDDQMNTLANALNAS
ncbi:hypothetical protein N431DRAFT_472501 [Stipitochalara longipes BDJ]|nr:hypothetical protein N431DRAFT_472501 [Stipitochalara longipes BDJ]